jgi:dUTP pyrophosphatase
MPGNSEQDHSEQNHSEQDSEKNQSEPQDEIFPLRSLPTMLSVSVKLLDPDLVLPKYANVGDAGLDLVARVDVELAAAGGRSVVPTGIAIAVPLGWGGFVLPRSGLAARHGVTVVNGPGLVDAGYRGEIMVPLINTDPQVSYSIKRGERIAQLLFLPVPEVLWQVCEELPEVPGGAHGRGSAGFGSSGR